MPLVQVAAAEEDEQPGGASGRGGQHHRPDTALMAADGLLGEAAELSQGKFGYGRAQRVRGLGPARTQHHRDVVSGHAGQPGQPGRAGRGRGVGIGGQPGPWGVAHMLGHDVMHGFPSLWRQALT